jgi:beta-glucanase (GH16 family)
LLAVGVVVASLILDPGGSDQAPPGSTRVPTSVDLPAPPAGFATVWSDDFTGAAGTGVNPENWRHATGHGYPGGARNWGTGEIETMTDSTANVSLDGAGHLAITPLRDAAGNWTSGRIETRRTDFAAPAGGVLRVEASIRQPNVTIGNGAGYWPAFWMLGEAARPVGATNWPGIGEIDIFEDVNGRSSLWGTLHCGTASGGPCNETAGLESGEQACPGCQTGFHTYAMEYDRSISPEQIRWYLDGVQYFTLSATAVKAKTWANAVQHGFFIILNVAIGGRFPAEFGGRPTTSTVSGASMLVDYVSVSTQSRSSTSNPVQSNSPAGPITTTSHPVGRPGIEFSSVPPVGSASSLTGRVWGVDPQLYRVAVFIKVDGSWWIKPYWEKPLTAIAADGTWACGIVTGGHDEAATQIEAFLIGADTVLPSHPSYSDVVRHAVARVSTTRW